MARMLSRLYLMRYAFVAYPIRAVSATIRLIVVRLRKQYRRRRSTCAPHCTIYMLSNAFTCSNKHDKRSSAATRIYM